MTSLTIKGHFDWAVQNGTLKMGVNHNGIPAHLALSDEDAVIMVWNGAISAVDDQGVSTPQLSMISVLNQLYQRRRIAWIKIRFIPRFTEIVTQIESGNPVQGINVPVYVVHDSDGVESDWNTMTATRVLANNTGVKMKKLTRPFKVFRRSRKFPYSPKYAQANTILDAPLEATNYTTYPSGQWLPTSQLDITGDPIPHTAIFADLQTGSYDTEEMFTVIFEIKYVWADRLSL